MELELGELLGRKVDLNTPRCLSPYFRERVLRESETQVELERIIGMEKP